MKLAIETMKWLGSLFIVVAQWFLFSKSEYLWASIILFPLGSALWIVASIHMKDKPLFAVNAVMLIFGVYGIYNWFLI